MADAEGRGRVIAPFLNTKRKPLAQLVFCQGCCCGRTDRDRPELPVEQLKAIWRTEKLNRNVQLTISGCLGPCDLANVTLVMTPTIQVWLGGLEGPEVYEALVEWARDCNEAETVLPMPAILEEHRFERWQPVSSIKGVRA